MDLKQRFNANPWLAIGVLTLVLGSLIAPQSAKAAPSSPNSGPRAFLPLISSFSGGSAGTLSLSKVSNRTNATPLNGQTVSGDVYIFLSAGSGTAQVRFYLDNASGSGAPFQTESEAPYDFAGGSAGANAFDTHRLSNGGHSITASISLNSGATALTNASFTVNNTTEPAPPAAIYWGVNMQGVPWDLAKLSTWEQNVAGKAVAVINWGHFWGNSTGVYQNWSNGTINNARSHGSIPMISWAPEGGDPGKWQLRKIIDGTHDAYIRQFATDAKAWGFPFFLRMMHEMNGNWGWPWQETQNGNQPGQFVQAWRHIVDIFRSVGVSNVSYVWCPNVDYPGSTWPTFASLYPGDGYVDWTCLDGYNWGATRPWGWQTFVNVFDYPYNEILKVAPSKPMMIGELGVVEQGGSKADWLREALGAISSRYGRIRAMLYYNWQFDGVDWRIETSQAAQDAWRNGIGSSYYSTNRFGSITGKVAVP